MRYAEIQPTTAGNDTAGQVVNVILADLGFDPGNGNFIVQSDTAQLWDNYVSGVFTPGTPPASS